MGTLWLRTHMKRLVKLLQMVRPGGTLLSMGVAVRPETGHLHPAH
jgi:hypothetical protein